METLVAKKYVKALLEIDGISLEDIQNQLKSLAEVIKNNQEVKVFLNSPLINNNSKFEALVAPIKDNLDKKLTSLLELMSQKGRLNIIPELSKVLDKEIMLKSNKFIGIVESNEDIDDSLKEKLEKKLNSYSGANVVLETKKSDLDGVKVEVKDLGLELNFSKESVKKALLEHIQKAL